MYTAMVLEVWNSLDFPGLNRALLDSESNYNTVTENINI